MTCDRCSKTITHGFPSFDGKGIRCGRCSGMKSHEDKPPIEKLGERLSDIHPEAEVVDLKSAMQNG